MRPRSVALATLLALVACGGGLSSAKSDYKKGRLADARSELEVLEPESKTWDDTRRAEYALYRGLVHLGLADRGAAGIWLREAKAIEAAHPRTLTDDDRVRLDLALESLAPPTP